MRLGIRILNNISTLNHLILQNQVQINPGETAKVLFQFVDLDQRPGGDGCPPLRYIPQSGATVEVKLTSIDEAKNITKSPSNPFSDDRSIWSFNLSATETASAAGINLKVTLTEGADIKIAKAEAVIIIGPKSSFTC